MIASRPAVCFDINSSAQYTVRNCDYIDAPRDYYIAVEPGRVLLFLDTAPVWKSRSVGSDTTRPMINFQRVVEFGNYCMALTPNGNMIMAHFANFHCL